jgi:MFS family permease
MSRCPTCSEALVWVDRISWVVTSYLAAVSVMIPMSGWTAVRFGRRRYLLLSVVPFVAASTLCGLAQTIDQMVVFRVIQGAAMIPLSQAILLETFPVAEHTLAMTTFGVGMMAAPVIGPTLGGWITDHAAEKLARHFMLQQPLAIGAKAGMVEARLIQLQVQEPAKQKVVVELLAQQPLAAHRMQRHQQGRLQPGLPPLQWF